MESIDLSAIPLYHTIMMYAETENGGQFLFVSQCLYKGCQYNVPMPDGNELAALDTERYLTTLCGLGEHHHVLLLDHVIQHYDVLVQSN